MYDVWDNVGQCEIGYCEDSRGEERLSLSIGVSLCMNISETEAHVSKVSKQTQNTIDQNKIQQFMNKAVQDIAGSSTAMLVIIGHRLGLYRAMAQSNSPVSVKELADKTGTIERFVREWLANQVASGYIEYDPRSRKYRLPP